MNKVNLLGRIGNDPEVRYMPNGNAVANFSMATTKRWTVKDTNEKKRRLSGIQSKPLERWVRLLLNTLKRAISWLSKAH